MLRSLTLLVGILLTCSQALAQGGPPNNDYLKNIIKKVRETSDAQKSPSVKDQPAGKAAVTTATVPENQEQNPSGSPPPVKVSSAVEPSAAANQPQSVGNLANVRHGELPYDRQYWQFLRYYRNHSVVSLIVSAADRPALFSALRDLTILRQRGIQIGEVFISGGPLMNSFFTADEAKFPAAGKEISKRDRELDRLIADIGLVDGSIEDLESALSRLNISSSPTWIVRYHGKDYVYEGFERASPLFTRDGNFTDSGE
jgi:hypothetical protein